MYAYRVIVIFKNCPAVFFMTRVYTYEFKQRLNA